MQSKNARIQNAGRHKPATKVAKSTTPKITRATSSKDRYVRLLETCIPESDAAYLKDEAVLGQIMSEFSFDEFMAIDPYTRRSLAISCGSPQFRTEILPFLGTAMRKRRQRLRSLLKDIREFFELRLQDYFPDLTSSERETATNHVITSAQTNYAGNVEAELVMAWTVDKMKQTAMFLKVIRTLKLEDHRVFHHIYANCEKVAYAAVWDTLAKYYYLGLTEAEVEEIVQITFTKIWKSIDEWKEPGTASLTSRVYEFAKWQALGWRLARKRERRSKRDLFAAEYRGVKSARKRDLSYYDRKDYDPIKS